MLTPLTDSTVEAVVLDWDGSGAIDRPEVATQIAATVGELCAAGIHVFVVSEGEQSGIDGLVADPDRPGRLHVCTGVDQAGKAQATRDAVAWLAERGITGRLVLILGEAHEAGGATDLLAQLDRQLARRRDHRVPWIDEDPRWVLTLPDEPELHRLAASLAALANGHAGLRGVRDEDGPGTTPRFVVNGVYANGAGSQLLPGPVCTHLDVRGGQADRRMLDLRTGVLVRECAAAVGLRTLRFVSAARPGAIGLRAEGEVLHLAADGPFEPPAAGVPLERARRGDVCLARSGEPGGGGIAVAARDREEDLEDRRVIERVAAFAGDPRRLPDFEPVMAALAELEAVGFDGLLAEHREAWARRWRDAEVVIEGDPESELAARFAVFHLLSSAAAGGEAAVGARGLTGQAYGGHVFWDADVFVLPALAAMHPGAARAMLEYRIRRLPAARAFARAEGWQGARFPWESARDGTDVTPRFVPDGHGRPMAVQSGEQEEHIVADVAWAACEYSAWTGDQAFLAGPGGALVLEAARYWASRVRVGPDGCGHLCGLMGPDEYHEVVDDNAFTNVMARWTLRRAADLAGSAVDPAEIGRWRDLAATLVDGWDPGRGVYEQFAGYWDLEPLLVAAVAEPPVAADVLLGRERIEASQLIKQADVLMLHHLVPHEVEPGSLAANLAFYDPRTAHGSSLSPAIHAALFARDRQPERALELFRIAAQLDLADLTGTSSAGLHLATMGGVWQALAYGFLGLRPADGVLDVDPCLPSSWGALALRLRFAGRPVGVRGDHASVEITCDAPIAVRVGGGSATVCSPPGRHFPLQGGTS